MKFSCADFASKALRRLRKVSRSWRSQTQRTPPGEMKTPRCLSSFPRAHLTVSGLLDRQRDDGLLDFIVDAVLDDRLLPAELL